MYNSPLMELRTHQDAIAQKASLGPRMLRMFSFYHNIYASPAQIKLTKVAQLQSHVTCVQNIFRLDVPA